MKENPEFFKAFPHLQTSLDKEKAESIGETTRNLFDKNDLRSDSSN